MIEILAILATAVLFALFGYLTRGRPRACGSDCSCQALRRGEGCRENPGRSESEHATR